MIEADRRGFAGRVRLIVDEPGRDLEAWDQEGVARSRNDCDRPWTDVLAEFESVRADGLAVLDEIDDGHLGLSGRHPLVGPLAIGDVLHEWPFHDREHLKQLLENTRAMLWPDLGTSQQFTILEQGE